MKLRINYRKREQAVTLVDLVTAVALAALSFGGIITVYIEGARRAEWSGYSLAAQALGSQQLEQARAAVWDNSIGKNEITNLNLVGWSYNASTRVGKGYSFAALDLPISGGSATMATNYVTVRMFPLNGITNPPVYIQMVKVETVWPFFAFGGTRFYTNRASNYFAPDNRDPSTL